MIITVNNKEYKLLRRPKLVNAKILLYDPKFNEKAKHFYFYDLDVEAFEANFKPNSKGKIISVPCLVNDTFGCSINLNSAHVCGDCGRRYMHKHTCDPRRCKFYSWQVLKGRKPHRPESIAGSEGSILDINIELDQELFKSSNDPVKNFERRFSAFQNVAHYVGYFDFETHSTLVTNYNVLIPILLCLTWKEPYKAVDNRGPNFPLRDQAWQMSVSDIQSRRYNVVLYEFLEYCMRLLTQSHKAVYFLAAFNGGRFDIALFLEYFKNNTPGVLKPYVQAGGKALDFQLSLKCQRETCGPNCCVMICFRDIIPYLPASHRKPLADLCKSLKFPEQKGYVSFATLDAAYEDPIGNNYDQLMEEKVRPYCFQDCRVLVQIEEWLYSIFCQDQYLAQVFTNGREYGNLYCFLTLSQIAYFAFPCYLSSEFHENLWVGKHSLLQWMRKAIYGGKCLSAMIGTKMEGKPVEGTPGTWLWYDLASMYPTTVNTLVPYGRFSKDPNLANAINDTFDDRTYSPYLFRGFVAGAILIREPLIHSEECKRSKHAFDSFPCVPARNGKQLYWPANGRIQGVYYCVDLYVAMLEGWKIRILPNQTYFWDSWSDEVGKFFERFYEIKAAAKRAGNFALESLTKIMLNSCYGKFGQRPQRSYTIDEDTGEVDWEQQEDKKKLLQFSMVTLSGSRLLGSQFRNICAFGIDRPGFIEGPLECLGRLVYCDTDCFVIYAYEPERLRAILKPFCERLPLGKFNLEQGKYDFGLAEEVICKECKSIQMFGCLAAKFYTMLCGCGKVRKVKAKGHLINPQFKKDELGEYTDERLDGSKEIDPVWLQSKLILIKDGEEVKHRPWEAIQVYEEERVATVRRGIMINLIKRNGDGPSMKAGLMPRIIGCSRPFYRHQHQACGFIVSR